MTDRTWEISDLDGSNKRSVTLADFRAEIEAAKAAALAKFTADAKRTGLAVPSHFTKGNR